MKQLFTVLFTLSLSLCVTAQTPESTEALNRLLGRNNAVWETTDHDGKFLYFRSDGTGMRSVRTKTSDDVRKQFVWKAISPTQVTLRFNKRARLDTITILKAKPDDIKVTYGNHIYDYIASYDADNSPLKLADMIWHPGGISETLDKVSISSLERQWRKAFGELDSHPGDKLHFIYINSYPQVILDGVHWKLGNIQFTDTEYRDSRKVHYSASPENVTRTVNTLKNWLAGSTDAFIEDGRVDVALLGTTGTGHNIYAKIYTDDKYVSLDIEFEKEKEHVPTAEEIRRQQEFDRMMRETDALLQQSRGIPTPSAQRQTVPVTVIVPPVFPVAAPTVGAGGSTGTGSRRHCQTCYGSGVCQTCGGDGIATSLYRVAGSTTNDYECPNCKQGHPRSDWGKCAVCHGTGKVGR